MNALLDILFSLLPVLGFLAALLFLDSFKLVGLRSVFAALALGGIAAGLALIVNRTLIQSLDLQTQTFTRYLAPFIEESLKAIYIIYVVRTRRVGFMVDAAIYGFAVGAGFAVVENIYYLQAVEDTHIVLWILRGLGTASMHGGTTAIFAILAHYLMTRAGERPLLIFGLSLLVATALHSLFNHFILPPVIMTALLLVCFPLLIVVVFSRSEKATRHWLGEGLDADMELWTLISSGTLSESRIGKYLESLTEHFPPSVVADMFCYLQLHIELAIQAKGLLLAREAGANILPDPSFEAKLHELKFLEASIGRTGRLAIHPFLHASHRDLWHLNLLGR